MKVTIRSAHVDEKAWNKDGRSGVIRTQEAQFETAAFRSRGRVDIGKNDPWPAGEYDCDLDDNVQVNNFGDVGLSRRLKLVPVAKPAAVKVAS